MRHADSSGPFAEETKVLRSEERRGQSRLTQTGVRSEFKVETGKGNSSSESSSLKRDSGYISGELVEIPNYYRKDYRQSTSVSEDGGEQAHCELVVYNPAHSIDHMLCASKLLIRRSWRSLPGHWIVLPILSYLAVELSLVFPGSVLGVTVPVGSFDLFVSFPLFILPLAALLAHAFWKIYNRHLILDSQYLIYYRGNCSALREVAEMEVGRMQVVTVKQSPWEALLGVGNVSLGTFTRRCMEFDLYGVANPHRLARLLKLAVKRARELEKQEATTEEQLAHLEQVADYS